MYEKICKNNSMKIFIIVILIFIAVFVAYEYSQYASLSKNSISCEGDFSHNVQCPLGTFCQSLKHGQTAGGICKTYLDSMFGSFDKK